MTNYNLEPNPEYLINFKSPRNAAGKMSISPIKNYTFAIRQLAYGSIQFDRPNKRDLNFKRAQESATKDVERAFGVVQSRLGGGDSGTTLTCLPGEQNRVDSSGDHDSKDEGASVDNDMANFLALNDVGMDNPDMIQDICNNLDIRVRGRKKK
nr:hypothetical protein [Tanacetum cinerariifolium]